MWFVCPNIEKERFVWLSLFFQPADSLLHYEGSGIALQLAHFLSIENEILWVFVVGCRIVLRGHPMIEAVPVRLRLFLAVELSVQMPFSNMAGFVSFAFEKFGECDFRFPQVNLMVGGDPPPNAIAVRGATRKDGRPGRRTDRAGRITLGEFGSLLGELIQVGGLDDGFDIILC